MFHVLRAFCRECASRPKLALGLPIKGPSFWMVDRPSFAVAQDDGGRQEGESRNAVFILIARRAIPSPLNLLNLLNPLNLFSTTPLSSVAYGATSFQRKGAAYCGGAAITPPSAPKECRTLLLTRFNKLLMSMQFLIFPPDFKSFPGHEGCKTVIISNKLYEIFRYMWKPYSRSMIRKCSMLFPQKRLKSKMRPYRIISFSHRSP